MLFLEVGMSENDSNYPHTPRWPGAGQLLPCSGLINCTWFLETHKPGIDGSHLHDIMMHGIPDGASNVCPVQ